MKKIFTKLINWEGVKNRHKPSAEEVFMREHAREQELSEEKRRAALQKAQEDLRERLRREKGRYHSKEETDLSDKITS
ncbi:MAG: hypothetical protein AAB857_00630 [Patescibacteria group bacterium]